jgi:transcriptional regulator with XRE-family HTH domain
MNQQHRAPRGAVPPVTLGLRIRMALDYAGLSQEHLMSRFEVSRATVSRWCRDVEPAPKKFVLNEIAVMCEVSPRWLIDGTAPVSHHPPEAPPSGRRGAYRDQTDTPDEDPGPGSTQPVGWIDDPMRRAA